MRKVADGVFTGRLIDKEQTTSILIELCCSSLWGKGGLMYDHGPGFDESFRKQRIISGENTKDQLLMFMDGVAKKIAPLAAQFFDLPVEHQFIDLRQYQLSEAGGFFKWHKDSVVTLARKVVSILYLSDFDEGLVGGETEFKVDSQIFTITPQKGVLVMFRPEIVHRGAKVVVGHKYALLTSFSDARLLTNL